MLTKEDLQLFEQHYVVYTKSFNVVKYGAVSNGSLAKSHFELYNPNFIPCIEYKSSNYDRIETMYAIAPINEAFEVEAKQGLFMNHPTFLKKIELLVAELKTKENTKA